MGKNDRDVVARRELTHALEALGDGIGHETWGPGPVIERLSKRELKEPAVRMATEALEAATMASHDLLHRVKRDDALSAIRRLAPVFLELIIEKDDGEKPRYQIRAFSNMFGAAPKPQSRAAAGINARIDEVSRMFRESNERMAKAIMPRGSIAEPPMAKTRRCVGCGIADYDEPSVMHPRPDGFARCNDCERDYASAY